MDEWATNLGCPVAKSVEQNTLYFDTQSNGGDILRLLQRLKNVAVFTLPAIGPKHFNLLLSVVTNLCTFY